MSKFALSPLAGVSDTAFRSLCYEGGSDYSVTEMVSVNGLFYDNEKTEDLMTIGKDEGKLGIQLFGRDPERFAKVIKEKVNHLGFTVIDLNLGCPAPKIMKNNEGSALMQEPLQVAQIVRSMVKTSIVPVSCKFRLGIDDDHINYLEIGKICQEEGAAFVTLHGRTSKQMYGGYADWEAIRKLKESLTIPVWGNGDVDSPESAKRMLDETGCDAIAIGRGALGRPFLFSQIKAYLATGSYDSPSLKELGDLILRHYQMELALKGERIAVLQMRKHIGWYMKGMEGSAKLKDRINEEKTLEGVKAILFDFIAERSA